MQIADLGLGIGQALLGSGYLQGSQVSDNVSNPGGANDRHVHRPNHPPSGPGAYFPPGVCRAGLCDDDHQSRRARLRDGPFASDTGLLTIGLVPGTLRSGQFSAQALDGPLQRLGLGHLAVLQHQRVMHSAREQRSFVAEQAAVTQTYLSNSTVYVRMR